MIVTKNECIEVFNSMIRRTPVSFPNKLLPMYSEYLTENNIENSDKLINLIVQNPGLLQQYIPDIINFYRKKYNILRIDLKDKFNNFKPILYYE